MDFGGDGVGGRVPNGNMRWRGGPWRFERVIGKVVREDDFCVVEVGAETAREF
jgi:hypothetical protein